MIILSGFYTVHIYILKERARLAAKFRPRPVVVSGGSPSPSCPATPRRPGSAESSNPVSPSSGTLQSVSRIYINKARRLFLGQFSPVLKRALF